MKNETGAIIERCQKKIQDRLDLRNPPGLAVKIRSFVGPDKRGHYRLEQHSEMIYDPVEMLCEYRCFDKLIGTFEESYPQLGRSRDKKVTCKAHLIEPVIRLGKVTIAGGHNWIIMGTLKSAEKFAAILDVEVRPMVRSCGLMTLMNHEEIKLAGGEGCDFIQTWHLCDNPTFLPAVIPELKAGFIFYHGSSRDGEVYENKGYIHLRHYFKKAKEHNIRVYFKDGMKFQSPVNNLQIIDYLKRFDNCPGREITEIEEY